MARRRKTQEALMPLRLARLHARLLISLAFGALVGCVLFAGTDWRAPTKLLLAWDVIVTLYLAMTFALMARATVGEIRHRAGIQDEGAFALLFVTVGAALASLAAIIAELGAPGSGRVTDVLETALAMGTILLSWAFMHTIFTLHYAHEYYGDGGDGQIGGLKFPGGGQPDYWDFLYFSLVVAMTSQVSDVAITSKAIRRLVNIHGIISFFFNFTVLALMVNMASSLIKPGS
jgi:uncharacterized membrane protein